MTAECAPGTEYMYSTSTGQGSCKKCSPGTYQDQSGKDTCNKCPGGRNSIEGAFYVGQCKYCHMSENLLVGFIFVAPVKRLSLLWDASWLAPSTLIVLSLFVSYLSIYNLIWYVSLFLIGWKFASIYVWIKKKPSKPRPLLELLFIVTASTQSKLIGTNSSSY